ncbi:hypothetical protein BDR07DRAFT_1430455 [Suillus spraguei]|nr:hypothetical protein BDR07DRAFT_1430455 [Suillus spraguei]
MHQKSSLIVHIPKILLKAEEGEHEAFERCRGDRASLLLLFGSQLSLSRLRLSRRRSAYLRYQRNADVPMAPPQRSVFTAYNWRSQLLVYEVQLIVSCNGTGLSLSSLRGPWLMYPLWIVKLDSDYSRTGW